MFYFTRFLLFYALWLILSEGRADLLAPGLAAAAATTGVSHLIWGRGGRRISIFAVLGYLPGFLWRSLKGGLDVSWRVLRPELAIAPAFVVHDGRDADEIGRVLLSDVLSLMPGTLGAGQAGRRATVHLLADDPETRHLIAEEDGRLTHVFADRRGGEGEAGR